MKEKDDKQGLCHLGRSSCVRNLNVPCIYINDSIYMKVAINDERKHVNLSFKVFKKAFQMLLEFHRCFIEKKINGNHNFASIHNSGSVKKVVSVSRYHCKKECFTHRITPKYCPQLSQVNANLLSVIRRMGSQQGRSDLFS